MVPSKAGGGDGKTITISGEADGPQRGNALGLLLADGKCSQAERGYQRAGLGLDEARHGSRRSIVRMSRWQPGQTMRSVVVAERLDIVGAESVLAIRARQGREPDRAAAGVGG